MASHKSWRRQELGKAGVINHDNLQQQGLDSLLTLGQVIKPFMATGKDPPQPIEYDDNLKNVGS